MLSHCHRVRVFTPVRAAFVILLSGLLFALSVSAVAFDIFGQAGSVSFGRSVAVLPNGNIVVTDPGYAPMNQTNVGAVYLFSPAGLLISSFTGSTSDDQVGSGVITVLTNGHFVIASPNWHNGAAANAGAVTWVNGNTGLSGTVSSANSLVGVKTDDGVGGGVLPLSNGNYVVVSSFWDNGAIQNVGAVTWANGSTGLTGAVSAANSLVGTQADDFIGSGGFNDNPGVVPLNNGNYVVVSPDWNNAAVAAAGAVTWGNGSTGLFGVVSTANSLVGTQVNDQVGFGGITALTNGNYVVSSYRWNNNVATKAGAVTWANGTRVSAGAVSSTNSLVGTQVDESIGTYLIALSNGNYVVANRDWDNGAIQNVGAVTWGDGSTGLPVGLISLGNSLVGTQANDQVGSGVTALSNGHYVVDSPSWDNGMIQNAGAVTWGNGSTGLFGPVSTANSLVGTKTGDFVGSDGVTALTNGHYVVASAAFGVVRPFMGVVDRAGAVTWCDGTGPTAGSVSFLNSLTGSQVGDLVGRGGVTALSNGNYVVSSYDWANGPAVHAGAVTWGNGTRVSAEAVSITNSLVGTQANDFVGRGFGFLVFSPVTALSNGNYVVVSSNWKNFATTNAGAVTWGNGTRVSAGAVSSANSLVGTRTNDFVGSDGVGALSNGNYVVSSFNWDNGGTLDAGAVSLGRGNGCLTGSITANNSVLSNVTTRGLVFAYDATRDQLVVGQPDASQVSLFKSDCLFADGFE